jgi:hypothetical protein
MEMDILSSINLNPRIKKRDRFFYDKYEYSVEFYLPTAILLRGISNRTLLRENIPTMFHKRAKLNKTAPRIVDPDYWSEINIDSTTRVFDILSSYPDRLVSITSKMAVVYINDLSVVNDLLKMYEEFPHINRRLIRDPLVITKCVIDRPKGTIKRKSTDYKYRIKMRHKLCTGSVIAGLRSFIETYEGQIEVSPSLKVYLSKAPSRYKFVSGHHLEAHHYINVNDEKLEIMLSMLAPGVIGEILEIIPYK